MKKASMNSYFIDTSALFRRYIDESGTAEIDEIFAYNDHYYISDLTIVEFISNLQRMHQIEEIIGQESFTAIKAQFFHDIADKIITTEPVTPTS